MSPSTTIMHHLTDYTQTTLDSLMEHTKNLLFDKNLKVTNASTFFTQHFDLPNCAAWSKNQFYDIFEMDEAEMVYKSDECNTIIDYLEAEKPCVFESKLKIANEVSYVRVIMVELKNQDPSLSRYLCLVSDVTKRKKQSAELQKVNIELSKKIFFEKQAKDSLQNLNKELETKNNILNNYSISLMYLAKHTLHTNLGLDRVLEQLLPYAQKILDVHRLGYWSYDAPSKSISLVLQYLGEQQQFETGSKLIQKDFPIYFSHILKEYTVIASDALNDEKTREFSNNYLLEYNIRSMLDQPVFYQGELIGIICAEYKYAKRDWKTEDVLFVKGLSDIITMSLQQDNIQRNQLKIQQQQEEIMLQNKELKQQQEEIQMINENLERIIEERNSLLAFKEQQITEYAHINAHELRAPFCRLKGLLHLMSLDNLSIDDLNYVRKNLQQSMTDLEMVVQKISKILNDKGLTYTIPV